MCRCNGYRSGSCILCWPHIEMRFLIANTTFAKFMSCTMILNHYLTFVFPGESIFSCFHTLPIAYYWTASSCSHWYFNNTIWLLRYRNSSITLCSLKRALSTWKHKRVYSDHRFRRIRIKVQPTRIADGVLADKPFAPWIIVPIPIIVQPYFVIMHGYFIIVAASYMSQMTM